MKILTDHPSFGVNDEPNIANGRDLYDSFVANPAEQSKFLAKALTLTRDPHNADDLVQDALLRALTNIQKFSSGPHNENPASSMRRWLYRIMFNMFATNYRKNIRLRAREVAMDFYDHSDRGAQANQSDAMLVLNKDIPVLFKGLDDEWIAIYYHYLAGFRPPEIAAILGIPRGTVSSRVFRIREHIKERLALLDRVDGL